MAFKPVFDPMEQTSEGFVRYIIVLTFTCTLGVAIADSF